MTAEALYSCLSFRDCDRAAGALLFFELAIAHVRDSHKNERHENDSGRSADALYRNVRPDCTEEVEDEACVGPLFEAWKSWNDERDGSQYLCAAEDGEHVG